MAIIGCHLPLSVRIKLRAIRKERGECTWCGAEVEGDLRNRVTGKLRTMCRKCLRDNADKLARYRQIRHSKGLCERCGKNPPKPSLKNCIECTEKVRFYSKKHQDATFFEKRARVGGMQYSVASAKMLWSLWKEQRGRCALTGERLTRTNSQLDHIFPVSKGGSNERSNLRWLLAEVNQAKRALTDDEFLLLCKRVVDWAERNRS
jgi:5-methylcytosine-specific restriction endonuclease McrA